MGGRYRTKVPDDSPPHTAGGASRSDGDGRQAPERGAVGAVQGE